MAQYTQRTQPMHRPGQSEHGHGAGGALAYGGKPPGALVAAPSPQPRAQVFPQPYVHQPGYGSAALSYRDNSYGRGVGGRLSLLGPGAYLPPPAPQPLHPPPADPPPFKKIRLSAERPVSSSIPHHQQLRVDTRESVSAYNTVEVLSPNPPSEPTAEDQAFRTTKDDLLKQISKVDREMALSDAMLMQLKKKQQNLEEAASKPARPVEPDEPPASHRSLAQCIYAENRKKAATAHSMLSHLGPPVLWPLYNQPQDTEIYHENIRTNRLFRKRLVVHIKRLKLEVEKKEETLAEAYSTRATEWARRVDRIEQGQKRKAKEARNREFFEKVFPELRKQREERERFNRLGARVKSEAELEEIADGLHEQEHEDKKMRSLTVVPPLLLDPRDRRVLYVDTNRRCMDMEAEHKDLRLRNIWTAGEKELFREKYLQHPKNFGLVGSFLPRKSVRDCVRYYYLSKKAENYKQLLRKPRQRRAARNPTRPQSEPELPAGVTTRLQRSQGGSTVPRTGEKDACEDPVVTLESVTCIPIPPDVIPPTQSLSRSDLRTPPLPSSPPPQYLHTEPASELPRLSPLPALPPDSPPADCAVVIVDTPPATTITVVTSVVTSTSSVLSTAMPPAPAPTPQPPSKPATPQPPAAQTPAPAPVTVTVTDTEQEERVKLPLSITVAPTMPVATVTCAVCGAGGAARGVSRSRAHHYGLREEAASGARVCEACHGRCVRARYTRCPVPACSGPRARRLRHLPPRWHDLPSQHKLPLMDDFQIPSDLSKCCLACFKRITRRLENIGDAGSMEPSEEEVSRFRSLLREHGTAWEAMAAASGKTPATLKAFYFTYRKRFQLDGVVSERTAVVRGSESEWSVSSSGDTDTASASSPRPPPAPPAPPRPPRRDEYDSSATETADEENDAPHHKIPVTTSAAATSLTLTCTNSAPQRNGPAPPRTVRDVVLNMIEISLMKNTPAVPPPIKPLPPKIHAGSTPRESLATLSVVNSGHSAAAPRSPHRPATITPLAQPPLPAPDAPKEGLVMVHIEPRLNPEPRVSTESRVNPESLLDLSVKRPRNDMAFPQPNKLYRTTAEFAYQQFTQNERSSPTQYKQTKMTPAPNNQRLNAQLKPAPNTKGSITLGTPVEGRVVGRRTPPDTKPGSITAGTPLHHLPEKRPYDFYNKRRSPAGAYYTTQQRPLEPSYSPNAAAYSRSPYGLEQRQIIMADFITSQQMHGSARRERPPSPAPPPPQQHPAQQHAPHPPHQPHQPHAPQYSPQQRREPVSVIQRLTPHHYPPPGHEAFTSLVDVASAATALPVPRDQHEKTNHHHHDIRIQERMQRDMAMAQKYHHQQQQMQYQAERDRRAQQAQYIERDRQITLQQGRERERALAAMQERQMSMEQHHQSQQQHLHDRIHHTQVVSSEEARRMMSNAATYTTAKHRPITPHHIERKDSIQHTNRPPAVSHSTNNAAPPAGAPADRPRPVEGTLTAASLINAIITHQIIQNTEQRYPTMRECDAAGGGVSVTVSAPPPAPAPPPAAPPDEHTTSIKLGDLASNIITRDFCSPTQPVLLQHHNRFSVPISEGYGLATSGAGSGATSVVVSSAGEEWKRREPPKHAPYLEPVSPPDNHHANRNSSTSRRYSGATGGATGGGGGDVMTAFHYVTNRIVEVMRDADERKPQLTFPTGGYAYPYSALNVSAGEPPAVAPAGPAPPAPPPPPEPAPLMSAQYEPLSDED